jgi:hypothetical protein
MLMGPKPSTSGGPSHHGQKNLAIRLLGAMEARRPHSSEQASWGRRDSGRAYKHRGQTRQAGDQRGRSPHQGTRHATEIDSTLGVLGRGPVLRPREKNDEFVQSWLQQTQARHSRLPAEGHGTRRPRATERSHFRTLANRDRKRSRSLSEPRRPTPTPAAQVEYRFEKRARHKTRDDKYEHKVRSGKKPVRSEQAQGPGTQDPAGRGCRRTKDKRTAKAHQEVTGAIPSHILRRSMDAPVSNREKCHLLTEDS